LIEKELHVQVFVRDNNVDQALRALKKKMQREGIFREMKLRGLTKNPPRGESGRRQKPSGAPVSSPAKSCSARVCYQ
jgi:ribosomal protein S21